MNNHSGANHDLFSSQEIQSIVTAYLDTVVQIISRDDIDTFTKCSAIDSVTISMIRLTEAVGCKAPAEPR